MANLQVKIDDQLNADAKIVAANLGTDVNTAVRVFLTQFVRENGFPFRPTADPFYSAKNMAALMESINQFKDSKTVLKTLEELEDMAK